ncbi:hypothetical protein BTE48_16830 [Oceanospirillum multiglobuliferum]|uniref:Uncharacterized protein n=1 Tax=Oceanospirillum multiglobuliferum TaxID=64969 RepID=A0A1V4T023_9GAMM|nr:hypothetical protein BTE48_16830 [Oceanospirillum multiglobuliferum]
MQARRLWGWFIISAKEKTNKQSGHKTNKQTNETPQNLPTLSVFPDNAVLQKYREKKSIFQTSKS